MIALISLLIIPLVIIPNAQAFDYWTNCSADQTSTNSPYRTNIQDLLHSFTYQALSSGFHNSSLGQPPNRAYALYLCRPDIDALDCSECVYLAHAHILQDCPTTLSALLWSDRCMLRYSNTSIFQTMSASPRDVLWDPQTKVLNETKMGLVDRVANSSGRFGTEEANVTGSDQVYALGQCTPDLNAGECKECLRTAIDQLPSSVGGKVFQPSCYVRFEPSKTYGDTVNLTFLLSPGNNASLGEVSQRPASKGVSMCGSSSLRVLFSAVLLLMLLI